MTKRTGVMKFTGSGIVIEKFAGRGSLTMNRDFGFIDRVSDFIVSGEKVFIFLSGLFISFAMFVQVLLRYVFSAPLFGIEEISVLVVSWFYFIGSSYCVHDKSDIKVDILFLFVKSPRIRMICHKFSLVVSMITAGILFYYTLHYALWMAEAHVTTPTFMISQNVGFSAIVVGSALMIFHLFNQLLKEFK